MIKTILVPLDGSPLAERALPYATALARAAKARLVPMHARSELVIADEPPYDVVAVAEKLRAAGIEAKPAIYPLYHEPIGPAIVSTARERQADLIVMSTQGRSGLGRWFYGSVADQVLRQAEVPVMLVPAACEQAWPTDRAFRVLVPLDGSPFAEEALGPAGELAEALGAEVLLVRTVETPLPYSPVVGVPYRGMDPEGDLARAREYLESVADKLRAHAKAVDVYAAAGPASTTIGKVAREERVDLVVMATHGYGGLSRFVLGSVATSVLRRSDVPLLLVRPVAVQQAAAETAAAAGPAQPTPLPPVESSGEPVTLTLSPSELDLIVQGLSELSYAPGRDWHLAGPARQLLTKLEQAEFARA